jgi:hypothetical protein
MKKILYKNVMIIVIIALFFINPVVTAIPNSFLKIKDDENTDKLLIEIISNDSDLSIEPIDRPRIFSFNSYIDVDIDDSVLNYPIPPDSTVHVPMDVTYWTDLPQHFLWFIPWRIRNLFLFHTILPLQKIYFKANDIPDWGHITFLYPDTYVEIPFEGETIESYNEIIISVREGAPSIHYKVDLELFCKNVGRINGFDYRFSIELFPAYVPCLEINAPQFTITPQNQSTVIPIDITNYGNKMTEITASIEEIPQGFQLILIPDNILLDISETGEIFLKVIPPNDFIGDEIIPIRFTAKCYPYYPGSATFDIIFYLVIRVVQ